MTFYILNQSSAVVGFDPTWVIEGPPGLSVAEVVEKKLVALCSIHGDEPREDGWTDHSHSGVREFNTKEEAFADPFFPDDPVIESDWEKIEDIDFNAWYLPS